MLSGNDVYVMAVMNPQVYDAHRVFPDFTCDNNKIVDVWTDKAEAKAECERLNNELLNYPMLRKYTHYIVITVSELVHQYLSKNHCGECEYGSPEDCIDCEVDCEWMYGAGE